MIFGLICALPEEATAIHKEISAPRETVRAGATFTQGMLAGKSVVSVLSGMGKVNAAMTAQILISEFKVNFIIFTGVAGGISPNYEIGDVVIAEETFQHDFGFHGEQFVLRAINTLPEIGIGTAKEPYTLPLSKHHGKFSELTQALKQMQKELTPVTVGSVRHQPQIHFGTVATGDQFIANESKKQILKGWGADAVEMEGASVAQVSARNEVPLLLIRSISDKAGEVSHLDFKSFFSSVSNHHAKLVVAAIRVLS